MSSVVRKGLRGLQAAAEFAIRQVDAAEAADLRRAETRGVDVEKVTTILDERDREAANMRAAIAQLQQRVSNLEARLDLAEVARQAPPQPPVGGAGPWKKAPR